MSSKHRTTWKREENNLFTLGSNTINIKSLGYTLFLLIPGDLSTVPLPRGLTIASLALLWPHAILQRIMGNRDGWILAHHIIICSFGIKIVQMHVVVLLLTKKAISPSAPIATGRSSIGRL